MAQFVLVNVVVAVLMKHLEETYKYKELDDEMEEELRQEMAALELTRQQEVIEMQDAHHEEMEEDGRGSGAGDGPEDSMDKMDEDATNDSEPKGITENSDEMSHLDGDDTDCMVGSGSNQPPSFTFSVRPPSEEQSHHSDDNSSLSPAKIPITMETLSTPTNTMLSPGLLSPTSLSLGLLSPSSLSPISFSPVSFSPHLLSPGAVTPSFSEPGIHFTSPPLSPVQQNPHLMHLRTGPSGRQSLTKQYSMDISCEGQLQHHGSVPDVWDKVLKEKASSELQNSSKNTQGISRSQPTLADVAPKADSLDSDPGQKTTRRQKLKHRLLRSRSSGAKYSRFKEKYKKEKCGEDNSAAQPMIEWSLGRSAERLPSSQCGSGETGSDMEDSLISHWAEEEAACDAEVKMITGEALDDDDDVKPTLTSYTSSDLEDPANTSLSSSNALPDSLNSSLDCDIASHSSAQPGVSVSHSHGQSPGHPSISPMAKSPRLKRRGSSMKSKRRLTDPGIDNSSFELGEETQTPKCDSRTRKAATPGSLKGLSPSDANTPGIQARSGHSSVSPVSVRQLTFQGSPVTPQGRVLQAGGSPLVSPLAGLPTSHPVLSPLTAELYLRPPVSGQDVTSPLSLGPGPASVLDRRSASPLLQRLHVCSTAPHVISPQPRPLSDLCDSSKVPASHFTHPLSTSPLPPTHLSRTDSPASLSASSSSTVLPSPSLTPCVRALTGTEEGVHPQDLDPQLLTPATTHPLQRSPTTPPPSSLGLFLPPPPSNPGGGSSAGSLQVRHRTLSSRQSSEPRDLAENSTGSS